MTNPFVNIHSVLVIKSPQQIYYGDDIKYSIDPTCNVIPQMDGTDGIVSYTKITMILPPLKLLVTINAEYNYINNTGNFRGTIINYIKNNIDSLNEESINEDLIYFIFS